MGRPQELPPCKRSRPRLPIGNNVPRPVDVVSWAATPLGMSLSCGKQEVLPYARSRLRLLSGDMPLPGISGGWPLVIQ